MIVQQKSIQSGASLDPRATLSRSGSQLVNGPPVGARAGWVFEGFPPMFVPFVGEKLDFKTSGRTFVQTWLQDASSVHLLVIIAHVAVFFDSKILGSTEICIVAASSPPLPMGRNSL